MIRIAILASGTGSNARCLMQYFENHPNIQITLVGSNKAEAGVLSFAREFNIETFTFSNSEMSAGNVQQALQERQISYIILAGFLALIPEELVHLYENKILNIHPSLLPKYGGKGMYGHYVHRAVKENKETESGISIHLVNTEFDKGKILFQARTRLTEEDSIDQIQKKVQVLEHQHFPEVTESFICADI